jgi:hypothetical protein
MKLPQTVEQKVKENRKNICLSKTTDWVGQAGYNQTREINLTKALV